jgi:predicted nucleic acid-binding protein
LAVLEDGPEVAARLVELCETVQLAGRQVHDANIVATMLAHGEDRLLTMNRSDFQRFEPRIEIVEP